MKQVLKILLVFTALLVLMILIRAAPENRASPPAAGSPGIPVDSGAVSRLAGAVRFPTVSTTHLSGIQEASFRDLHRYLSSTFPRVHRALTREPVGGLSLLYTWKGSDPGLQPILLMAHQDVVPVDGETRDEWVHEPFSGAVSDGYVWGRGAVDDKSSLMGILEAAEGLLANDFRPRRTVILFFGHDEEIGGERGAAEGAALLADRGIRPLFVLDEGSAIVHDLLPGLPSPVALIGTAEKGYLSVELRAACNGGHSSIPDRETAIDLLAAALMRVRSHPLPARLQGPTRGFLEALSPHLPFSYRILTENLWLPEALITGVLSSTPEMDAAVRTTMAPTLLAAGTKDNVIPEEARAILNFRLLPGDTRAEILRHLADVVADPRITIRPATEASNEATKPSGTETQGYRLLQETIQRVFPGTLVSPFLTLGGTDSKHFRTGAEGVYQFAPDHYIPGEDQGVHATNERMSVGSYMGMIRFYRALIMDAAG